MSRQRGEIRRRTGFSAGGAMLPVACVFVALSTCLACLDDYGGYDFVRDAGGGAGGMPPNTTGGAGTVPTSTSAPTADAGAL